MSNNALETPTQAEAGVWTTGPDGELIHDYVGTFPTINEGEVVHGTVVRSVIGPGVVVEEGAEVRDAVLLHNSHVGARARVTRAIVDDEADVGEDMVVGGSDEITVVAPRPDP